MILTTVPISDKTFSSFFFFPCLLTMSSFSSTAPIPRTANDLLASYTNFERQYQTHRISLRVLIPRSYSGKIIGPQGRTIQNIINFYHVFLQFSKCESSREFKRLFTIRGRAEDCAMACTNCFEMLLLAYNDPVSRRIAHMLHIY